MTNDTTISYIHTKDGNVFRAYFTSGHGYCQVQAEQYDGEDWNTLETYDRFDDFKDDITVPSMKQDGVTKVTTFITDVLRKRIDKVSEK